MVSPDSEPVGILSEAQTGLERERLREKSKCLLGNRDRLEVAVAIARSPDPAVNATDLSADLDMANTRVRAQLIVFLEAGLLIDAPPQDLKRWYLRRDSPFWEACLDLFDDWISQLR